MAFQKESPWFCWNSFRAGMCVCVCVFGEMFLGISPFILLLSAHLASTVPLPRRNLFHLDVKSQWGEENMAFLEPGHRKFLCLEAGQGRPLWESSFHSALRIVCLKSQYCRRHSFRFLWYFSLSECVIVLRNPIKRVVFCFQTKVLKLRSYSMFL